MANYLSFAPSATLRTFQFSSVDDFRKAVRKFQVEFTPFSPRISAEQALLNLPGLDLSLAQSFPRLADTRLAPNCTAICFSMDDRRLVRFNGVDVDMPLIALGHGGDHFTTFEEVAARTAVIVFTPEIHGRGWPETHREFFMRATTGNALQRLRLLMLEVFKLASDSVEATVLPASTAGIKESLLTAIDQAFAATDPPVTGGSLHPARLFSIFRKIEDHLRENLANPVYSEGLAKQIGVSVRTLQDVIMLYRGVSLHRYLRLKRLWLVRQRLLAGNTSVKSCALAFGFWHLSDFSRSYRIQFQETPSETIARAH